MKRPKDHINQTMWARIQDYGPDENRVVDIVDVKRHLGPRACRALAKWLNEAAKYMEKQPRRRVANQAGPARDGEK